MSKLNMTREPISVTIELPPTTHLTNKSGLSETVDWAKVAAFPALVAEIVQRAGSVVLLNAYNGNGPKGETRTPDEKLAQMRKRLDAWYAGNYVVVERESNGAAKELFIADYAKAAQLPSINAAEKSLAELVKVHLPKDGDKSAPATFENMLKAIAVGKGLTGDAANAYVNERLDKYGKAAAEKAAAAAKVIGKMDLSSIDI